MLGIPILQLKPLTPVYKIEYYLFKTITKENPYHNHTLQELSRITWIKPD